GGRTSCQGSAVSRLKTTWLGQPCASSRPSKTSQFTKKCSTPLPGRKLRSWKSGSSEQSTCAMNVYGVPSGARGHRKSAGAVGRPPRYVRLRIGNTGGDGWFEKTDTSGARGHEERMRSAPVAG